LSGSSSAVPFPISTLSDSIASILTTSLDHLSSSLLSTACGRDLFSHVSTCFDCHESYRDWLCRIVIPQCVDSASSSNAGSPAPRTVIRNTDESQIDGVDTPYAYTELKPCLSTCNRADRTCPVFLGFRCPRRRSNANESYAFMGLEVDENDGSEETGPAALDRWGNRWCNG
jgi:calcium channel MID1